MDRAARRMDAYDRAYTILPRRFPLPVIDEVATLLDNAGPRQSTRTELEDLIQAYEQPAAFLERALVLTAREREAFSLRHGDRVRMHLISRDHERLVDLAGAWAFWCGMLCSFQTTVVVVPNASARRQFLSRAIAAVARVPGHIRAVVIETACSADHSWIAFDNDAKLCVCTPATMPRSMAVTNAIIFDFVPKSANALASLRDYLCIWQTCNQRLLILSSDPKTPIAVETTNDPMTTVHLDD